MKNFCRNDHLFSLCGLNCGLCTMNLDNYCPGCGGGPGNQPCAIARCSSQHGAIEYCYLCDEYPCEKYDGIDEYDSFITHRNQLKDNERVRNIGIDAYRAELTEKRELLKFLLANFNDGRRKSFFCISVNLLPLEDVRAVVKQITDEAESGNFVLKEKAALAASLLQALADKQNIVLKYNKKTSKK